jgi:ketosteroid isomerase-like protein
MRHAAARSSRRSPPGIAATTACEFWRGWLAAWETIEFEVEDVLDAGDSVVALIGDQHLHGRRSGVEVDFPPYAIIFTVRTGKVIRWAWFPDRAEALEAAGLSE